MPFVGCNLLLSHWIYIKAVLQATSYERTSTVSPCFPAAPGQRPSGGAQRSRQPRVTILSLGRVAWLGFWRPQKGSQARAPVVQTAMRGGLRTRGRGPVERKHIFR